MTDFLSSKTLVWVVKILPVRAIYLLDARDGFLD